MATNNILYFKKISLYTNKERTWSNKYFTIPIYMAKSLVRNQKKVKKENRVKYIANKKLTCIYVWIGQS